MQNIWHHIQELFQNGLQIVKVKTIKLLVENIGENLCQNSSVYIGMGLLGLHSAPIGVFFYPVPTTQCLSCVLRLGIWSSKFPICCSLIFSYFCPLHFHINLRITLKPIGILWGLLNLWTNWTRIKIFTKWMLLIRNTHIGYRGHSKKIFLIKKNNTSVYLGSLQFPVMLCNFLVEVLHILR